jgi:hypothetical protein
MITNGSFEEPRVTPGVRDNWQPDASFLPGWFSTASDNLVEVWTDGFGGIQSYDGDQHVELNAFEAAALYQDIPGIPAGSGLGFGFAHRGRADFETMRLTITDLGADGDLGGGDDTVLFTKDYTTGVNAWVFYSDAGEPTITALGNTVRFSCGAVGGTTVGNFLDFALFGAGVPVELLTFDIE